MISMPASYLCPHNQQFKSFARYSLATSAGLISAKVVKVDAANDLALLKAEGQGKVDG